MAFPFVSKTVFLLGFLGCAGLILAAFYASFYPPHLLPETDAINYHYTLPRQHLILNSFAHLPWSVADLFTLPFTPGTPDEIQISAREADCSRFIEIVPDQAG